MNRIDRLQNDLAKSEAAAESLAEQLAGVLEHNKQLQKDLMRYGLHTWDCAWNDSKGKEPCNCGWEHKLMELS